MSQKLKDIMIYVNAFIMLGMIVTFIATRADKVYVDKGDDVIQKNLEDYQSIHQIQHTSEYNDLSNQITNVESKTQTIYDWVLTQPKKK